jgi:hypothetical protein
MRLRLLAWLPGLALAGALLAPTAALATETETIHFSDTVSFPEVNPCSGATGTLTIDFKGVFHITALDNGTFHVTGTDTGTFTFVPDDPSQPTYTGHFASWFGENVNSRNFTATSTFNLVLKGSDGSRLKEHALFHFTVNANGTVTSEFEIDEFTCP